MQGSGLCDNAGANHASRQPVLPMGDKFGHMEMASREGLGLNLQMLHVDAGDHTHVLWFGR